MGTELLFSMSADVRCYEYDWRVPGANRALFSAEDPVAGIAKPWDDVGMLIEALIDRCDEDVDIIVGFLYHLYAFGCSHKTHQRYVCTSQFL